MSGTRLTLTRDSKVKVINVKKCKLIRKPVKEMDDNNKTVCPGQQKGNPRNPLGESSLCPPPPPSPDPGSSPSNIVDTEFLHQDTVMAEDRIVDVTNDAMLEIVVMLEAIRINTERSYIKEMMVAVIDHLLQQKKSFGRTKKYLLRSMLWRLMSSLTTLKKMVSLR